MNPTPACDDQSEPLPDETDACGEYRRMFARAEFSTKAMLPD